MNSVIEDIIRRDVTTEQKMNALASLEEDIAMAKRILSPEFCYCRECDDYYLTESFLHKEEVKDKKICTYTDPINSGGNEYRDGKMQYHYLICPKGHKHLLHMQEVG